MRVLAMLLLVPAVALAQQGAKPAAGLISEKVLPLDMAVDIARGAIDKCRADGYRTTVAILDAAGNLKLSARDDGTSPHTVEVARKKAYTALIYRRASMRRRNCGPRRCRRRRSRARLPSAAGSRFAPATRWWAPSA